MLTADACYEGLVGRRHGKGALTHPVVAGAGEAADDVTLDGQLLMVGHVVEETDHSYAHPRRTVIAVKLTMGIAVVGMMGVDYGLLAYGVALYLPHPPAEAVVMERTRGGKTHDVVIGLFAEQFGIVHRM